MPCWGQCSVNLSLAQLTLHLSPPRQSQQGGKLALRSDVTRVHRQTKGTSLLERPSWTPEFSAGAGRIPAPSGASAPGSQPDAHLLSVVLKSQTTLSVLKMIEIVKIIKTDSQTKGTGQESMLRKNGDSIPALEVTNVSGRRNGQMTFS